VPNPPNIVELRLLFRSAYRVFSAERELRRIRSQEMRAGHLHELLGSSAAMLELFALVGRVGPCDVNVLITGETGTGKELLARAIHHIGPRSSSPLVAFSCANLPEALAEDELFGHEKGAFTGAIQLRQGRIESANHGTLFLDEIGDMGLAVHRPRQKLGLVQTGSGPGGRWFKSTRPDHLLIEQGLTTKRRKRRAPGATPRSPRYDACRQTRQHI
jgi:DNA-binding NtrC family response regulator